MFFGEKHGVRENFEYYLEYIKKFSKNEQLTILFEIGYSAGIYINEYIRGNEISSLDKFVYNFKNTLFGTLEFKKFIIELKELNKSLTNKLNFIGIDIEHQVNIAEEILEYLKLHKRRKDITHVKRNLKYSNKIIKTNDKYYEKWREIYLCKNFSNYYNSENNYVCFMGSYHTKLELNVKNLIKYVESKNVPFLTLEVLYLNSKRTIKDGELFKEISINDEIRLSDYLVYDNIYILKNDKKRGSIIVNNAKAIKMLLQGSMEEIIVATNNPEKVKEIKEILKEYNLKTLKDVNCEIEVVEDTDTFEGNSKKKAKEISEILNKPCLADDGGLCIDYLDGWPGVFTGRTIGKNKENLDLILERMQGVPYEKRTARAICYMVYYNKGEFTIGKGELVGKIAMERKGDNGFGFDEVFELEDGTTLAEISSEEKNKISARYLALMDLQKKMIELENFM